MKGFCTQFTFSRLSMGVVLALSTACDLGTSEGEEGSTERSNSGVWNAGGEDVFGLVADIFPGIGDSLGLQAGIDHNNDFNFPNLYFGNGTAEGTLLAPDIYPGPESGFDQIGILKYSLELNTLFFTDKSPVTGVELYKIHFDGLQRQFLRGQNLNAILGLETYLKSLGFERFRSHASDSDEPLFLKN